MLLALAALLGCLATMKMLFLFAHALPTVVSPSLPGGARTLALSSPAEDPADRSQERLKRACRSWARSGLAGHTAETMGRLRD